MIDILTGTAFDAPKRMHHREDELTLEFPSSAGPRARGLVGLKVCNWRASAPPGPALNWIDGFYLNTSYGQTEDPLWSILDEYLPIIPRSKIEYKWARSGNYSGRCIVMYDTNLSPKNYWQCMYGTDGARVADLSSYPTYVYCRFCCLTADKDYCYVRNNTTGEYLYKGALVP